MSSEQLADGVNPLDAELAATWDVLKGYSGRDTDLGIARRFGGAAAAYSLRDIGAMNGPVVRVRRDSNDDEEDFSANQVASGALETFVQDGATQKGLTQSTWQNTGAESFSSTSTDGFSYSNSSGTAFIGVTLSETLALNDSVFVSFNASGITHPSSSDQSPQIRLRDAVGGGNGSSPINQVTNGFNSYTLTYNDGTKANGNHIVFSEGDTAGGTVTISDFKVFGVSRNGFVETWYDQSGNGRDMIQDTATAQPAIVQNGGSVRTANGYHSIQFDGTDDYLNADSYSPAAFATGGLQDFNIQTVVGKPVLNSTNETVASCGSQEGSNVIGGFLLIHKQSTDATLQDVRFHISQGGQSGTHIAQISNTNKTTQDTNLLGFSRNSTDDGYILDLNENTSTATNTLYPATKQTGENANFKLGSAMYNSTALKFYSGQILETILFESNKEDDTSDIQNDLNNFYDI